MADFLPISSGPGGRTAGEISRRGTLRRRRRPTPARAIVPPIQIQLSAPAEPGPPPGADASGLSEFWEPLWRRRGIVTASAILCSAAAVLIALPQTPMYQARASLEVQGLNENFLNIREVDPNAITENYSAESYIQTQVRILQDEAMLDRVVAKLQLDQRPEFAPRRGISARDRAVAYAGRHLKVRSSGQSRIIEILFDSPDPGLAATFVNTLASEFIDQNLEVRWKSAQKTGEWLTRQLGELKTKLEISREALVDYARGAGLTFVSEKGTAAEDNLKQLQEELSKSRGERVARQSRFETAVRSSPQSVPEVLDNDPLRTTQAQLHDLKRQLAELSAQFTPEYYKVKNIQAHVTELESILKKERGNIVQRLRNEYDAALRREHLVGVVYGEQLKLVTDQASRTVHYDMLKQDVDTNRTVYESMLQKVKEAGVAAAMRASNFRVLNPARPPARPCRPDLPLSAALGLGAGLVGACAFVLASERAGKGIRAPGDSAMYLELPELGVIPSARALVTGGVHGRRATVLDVPGRPEAGPRETHAVELATWERKPSLLAESFRATLASMMFSRRNGGQRVIALASPDSGAGKTTVVSNLGIALAEIHRRVLLIDGDMRKPRLHDIFKIERNGSLGAVLREDWPLSARSLNDIVHPTEIPGLYVLPSRIETDDISALLHSSRMAELLRRLRTEFHTILIDTPPMLQLPDARIIGRLAGEVILVIRSGRTAREDALAASQRFREDGTTVAGTILNYWQPDGARRAYYGYRPASAPPRKLI